MNKEKITLIKNGEPNISGIKKMLSSLTSGGFVIDEFECGKDYFCMGIPCKPRHNITVSISKVEEAKEAESEFSPGDKVYTDIEVYKESGRECLYIGMHPEHPVHILETPDNQFIVRMAKGIHKERPKPKEEKPTPLNIPWDSIDKRWNYAAMDKGGFIALFENKPEPLIASWITKGGSASAAGILDIPTKDINWKLSLTKRPEVVNIKWEAKSDEEKGEDVNEMLGSNQEMQKVFVVRPMDLMAGEIPVIREGKWEE